MSRQRGYASILIITVLVVIVAGAYSLGKNSDKLQNKTDNISSPAPESFADTTSWITYEDVKNGYSLEYPSSYTSEKREWGIYLQKDKVAYSVNVDGGITLYPPATEIQESYLNRQRSKRHLFKNSDSKMYMLYDEVNYKGKNYIVGYGMAKRSTLPIPPTEIETLERIHASFKFTN